MWPVLLLATAGRAEPPSVVDEATGLRWAAQPGSGGQTFEQAISTCAELGEGWRLPTRGELETLAAFAGPMALEGVLFSGEEVPGALDRTQRHPWVMNPANGHVYNGAGKTGHAWCVHGPPTRVQAEVAVPQGWWSAPDACPDGGHVVGSPGGAVWCEDPQGRIHGRHVRWLGDAFVTEGTYVQGERHGRFATTRADGSLSSEEHYVAGKLDGRRTEYDEQGRVAATTTFDRGRVVDAIDYDERGRPRRGRHVERYEDGTPKQAGRYRRGRAHGPWFDWAENGVLSTASTYDRGRPDGVVQRWFDDGRPIVAATWVDGERHGPSVSWRHDGVIEVTWMEHGVEVREQRFQPGEVVPDEIARLALPPEVPRRVLRDTD